MVGARTILPYHERCISFTYLLKSWNHLGQRSLYSPLLQPAIMLSLALDFAAVEPVGAANTVGNPVGAGRIVFAGADRNADTP